MSVAKPIDDEFALISMPSFCESGLEAHELTVCEGRIVAGRSLAQSEVILERGDALVVLADDRPGLRATWIFPPDSSDGQLLPGAFRKWGVEFDVRAGAAEALARQAYPGSSPRRRHLNGKTATLTFSRRAFEPWRSEPRSTLESGTRTHNMTAPKTARRGFPRRDAEPRRCQ